MGWNGYEKFTYPTHHALFNFFNKIKIRIILNK